MTTHSLRKAGNIHAKSQTTVPETTATTSAPDQIDSESTSSFIRCIAVQRTLYTKIIPVTDGQLTKSGVITH
jgi:hypothetical protein